MEAESKSTKIVEADIGSKSIEAVKVDNSLRLFVI